jgi:hypothetical protein
MLETITKTKKGPKRIPKATRMKIELELHLSKHNPIYRQSPLLAEVYILLYQGSSAQAGLKQTNCHVLLLAHVL